MNGSLVSASLNNENIPFLISVRGGRRNPDRAETINAAPSFEEHGYLGMPRGLALGSFLQGEAFSQLITQTSTDLLFRYWIPESFCLTV